MSSIIATSLTDILSGLRCRLEPESKTAVELSEDTELAAAAPLVRVAHHELTPREQVVVPSVMEVDEDEDEMELAAIALSLQSPSRDP